jgi:hypothetical protein
MSATVSRTVCQIANLATFSLFATAMMIAVVNGVHLRGNGAVCTTPKCATMMAKVRSAPTDQSRVAAQAITVPVRGT